VNASLRGLGLWMIGLGGLAVAGYSLSRAGLWAGFLGLAWPLKLGFGLGILGLLAVIVALVRERIGESGDDRSLIDEP